MVKKNTSPEYLMRKQYSTILSVLVVRVGASSVNDCSSTVSGSYIRKKIFVIRHIGRESWKCHHLEKG